MNCVIWRKELSQSYDKKDGQLILVDEVEATHIGCEYGEYAE